MMRMLTVCLLGVLLGLAGVSSLDAQSEASKLPRVLVLATGGTIAHLPDRYISGEQLIHDIPQLAQYVRLEVEEFGRIPSSEVSPDIWLRASKRINELLKADPELSGIVVTHGSNTTEETAYFLNLTVRDPRPVVLVAAQRRHGTLGSDGPHNLVDAVRVASDPASRNRGVLVAVNGEINAAREVTKTLSFRVETYESPDLGNLGYIDSDKVVYYRGVERRHTIGSEFDLAGTQALPRVDIVYAAGGIDGEIVRGLMSTAKPKGIVVAGFPTGEAYPAMEKELEAAAAQGTIIVMTNRGGSGRLPGRTDQRKNWIQGDNLTPQKARILLMVALASTKDVAELRRIFEQY